MRGDVSYYLIVRNLVLLAALILGVPLVATTGGVLLWTMFVGHQPSFFAALGFTLAALAYVGAVYGALLAWGVNDEQHRKGFRIDQLESQVQDLQAVIAKLERASKAASSGSRLVPL